MTDAQKIQAILTAIQDTPTLLTLMRLMISNNIINVPSVQLTAMCTALGIPTS